MNNILDSIYVQIQQLHEQAKVLEESWHKEIARRENSRHERGVYGKERTNYNFRVKITATSFVCVWEYVMFVKRASKTIRIANDVKLNENQKYKITQFKNAEHWEIELINSMEKHLPKIRLQVRQLMKAHQAIVKLKQLAGIDIKTKKPQEYLTKSNSSVKIQKEKYK